MCATSVPSFKCKMEARASVPRPPSYGPGVICYVYNKTKEELLDFLLVPENYKVLNKIQFKKIFPCVRDMNIF